MRILYHHRTLADGAEGIHIAEMVSAFRSLGHEVRVLGLGDSPSPVRAGVLARLRQRLPAAAYELASVACNPLEARAVRRAAAAFRPDLLYKRHARNDVGALAAARGLGIPTVLEVNCLYSSHAYLAFEPVRFRRLTERLEKRALALADVVLAVSSPLARQAEALGGREVRVMPNGANPDAFDPARVEAAPVRERLGLHGECLAGWTGILRAWHGLDVLLEAVAPLPAVKLAVVGDGPERGAVERRVRELGLEGRVLITGRVPHAQVPAYLAAFDLAVIPDERTGIASPMKLLEYMAMGLAVVAPDEPNIRDIVQDGVEGVLVRRGDPAALSRALARLAGDAGLRARLGRAARTKVERERNWRRNAATVLETVRRGGAGSHRAGRILEGQHV